MTSWSEYFQDVADPRRAGGRLTHVLSDILGLSLCAMLCGADDFVEMATFGLEQEEFLRAKIGLVLGRGVPSHDTLRRVFGLLVPHALQGVFAPLAGRVATGAGGRRGGRGRAGGGKRCGRGGRRGGRGAAPVVRGRQAGAGLLAPPRAGVRFVFGERVCQRVARHALLRTLGGPRGRERVGPAPAGTSELARGGGDRGCGVLPARATSRAGNTRAACAATCGSI